MARKAALDEVLELWREEAHILAERWSSELVDDGVIADAEELVPFPARPADYVQRGGTDRRDRSLDVDIADRRPALGVDNARVVRAWIRTRLGRPAA